MGADQYCIAKVGGDVKMGVMPTVSKDNIDGFIALVSGIILFKALTYVGSVELVLARYPVPIVVFSLGLFFYRKKIAQKIKGGKG